MVAFATGFGSIFAARVLLGVAEAPAFPANSKATGYWFPRGERATATAIFDAAAKFSNVIGVPLVAIAVVTWRLAMGFWPHGDPQLRSTFSPIGSSTAIRAQIRSSRAKNATISRKGGATPEGESEASPIGMLGYLLRNRKVWGLTIGFAAYGYSFYLFLTWLPGYLVSEMHMSIIKSAGYAAIPVAVRDDLRSRRRRLAYRSPAREAAIDDTKTRKTVLVGGMILGLAVFGATMTAKPGLGDFLDLDRAERPCGGRAGRLVNPFPDRAEGRHRNDRRSDELFQQSHGSGGAGSDRLCRRRHEFVFDRLPGCRASCC